MLRATLRHIDPPIWRLVRIPNTYTLHQLHRVLQLLFGWADYHLYDIRVGERRFEAPDPEAEDEDSTAFTLRKLRLDVGSALTYRYDFGDEWEADLVVQDTEPMSATRDETHLPVLLDGARAGSPEDVGGPHGYTELVAALARPRGRKRAEYRRWPGPPYHPERFDPWLANQNLTLAAAWGAI